MSKNIDKIQFFSACQQALEEDNPSFKALKTYKIFDKARQGLLSFEKDFDPPKACEAGRPSLPALVPPKDCAPRSPRSVKGRMSLIHALAHIEFNAINLALDACVRFMGMPDEYYLDWIQVARDEAYHFQLLRTHLNAFGYDYGDFPAHNGLWEMAQKTAHDALARMGCVPRIMEARGLDVAPSIAKKLVEHNDANAGTLLEIIMRDEERHVEVGNRWFHYLCKRRKVEPLETFSELVSLYAPGVIRPPLAKEARLRSGFSENELQWLQAEIDRDSQVR